ncbi:MAG: CDGSH iron-sulfur domain-containing protein [Flavobacteriales bacterium]|nr:CDGSH iron-sulfur domain-containing protein [Flavobacteriales bacterium]MCB9448553.1 CDGSH iron-sulfur domain-containing protein [Flavobacteriales bacterium]
MSTPKVAQKSPYVIEVEPGTYAWCACGHSTNQPFCDGSHKTTEFKPIVEKISEKKTVAWCGCKHSGKAPFCDGTHKKLD